jgi:protein tyrosine phosphatase
LYFFIYAFTLHKKANNAYMPFQILYVCFEQTDHDPRNPAYIATQGPLPHTAPDFWQMVWEQGSVVMVMLTRLTENGTAMCHRYWPEEGSELYHIYEVRNNIIK